MKRSAMPLQGHADGSGKSARRTCASAGWLLAGFVGCGLLDTAFTQTPSGDAPVDGASVAPGTPAARGHRAVTADQILAHLTARLDLNADQQSKIKVILERRQQQLMQMRSAASPTAINRALKIETIDSDTVKRIRLVLDDRQRELYRPGAGLP